MNVFDNSKLYLDEITNNVKIKDIEKLNGKSFICAFFTKKCRAGCKFCFFKSNFRGLDDVEESYQMTEEGFQKFIKFVNDSNNGYLLLSGGGEPFEKSDYVIRTVANAKTDRIVMVTNGFWAKDYDAAKEMIDNLHEALYSRDEIIPITLRLSCDQFHYANLGKDLYNNIIDIFTKYYPNDENFKLKIHTIIGDETILNIANEKGFTVGNDIAINTSDNEKIFKLMPQKFKLNINDNYSIDVSAAKLFYPTVKPDLTKDINQKALEVFDEDIMVSESYNPARVTNINGEDGLDFWVNYNGNITTWQNEQKNKTYNLYVDDYNTIAEGSYDNILSYSVIDKGYYYRENIINEVNKQAVLRAKLSNMRDLSTSLLLNESKTDLYYAIRVLQDYKDRINLADLNPIIRKLIDLPKEKLIELYNQSDYSIIDEYIEDNSTEVEWRDLFDLISLGEYEASESSIQRGIDYFNKKFNTNYESIDEIESEQGSVQVDRIIEKLTRMKKEAREKCMFQKGLETEDLSLIKQVSKSDVHAHSTRSGKLSYFEDKYDTKINLPTTFKSIPEMNKWYDKNIKPFFTNETESFEERLKSAFVAAEEDNVKKLVLSFGTGNIEIFEGNIDKYIKKIEEIKQGNYTGEFIPELCLVRGRENDNFYKQIIDRGYFRSIDLVGNEKLGVDGFTNIYRYAKDRGMNLRCHVGEYESSKFIEDAVDKLNLDEIQHGLSMVEDKELMKKVRDNNIQVNLCPASNVALGRVEDYSYPLRTMLDNNIKVTVNTDDLLLFDKTISQIFIDLYKTGLFTIEELNEIRNNGLNSKCANTLHLSKRVCDIINFRLLSELGESIDLRNNKRVKSLGKAN